MPQDAFSRALTGNAQWRKAKAEADSTFFPNCAAGQAPKILWIGCSDSRMPETTILGLEPGDVFTHRNIANLIMPGDLSSLAVIEFAVVHLKVDHVVVCGHDSCGGVMAVLADKKLGIMDPWLAPLRALRTTHSKELEKLDNGKSARRLAELSVMQSLEVLKSNAAVIGATKDRGLKLHGAIFDLASGKVEVIDGSEDIGASN